MDLIDKRDEVLRIFLEYGITENTENNLTKTDLAECAEQIVKKLIIGGVVSSLNKICTDLNIDTEEVLLEYDKKLNGFEVLYDEGIEQTFYVRKGFIQL